MRGTLVLCLVALVATSVCPPAAAKKVETEPPRFASPPLPDAPLPLDLRGLTAGPARTPAVADTFVLHFADFEGVGGPDPMGYTSVSAGTQIATFFHVAEGTELDGGDSGHMLPLNGLQSMWCGVDASTTAPYCGYATLPGYGNGWDQYLESDVMAGDSLEISYKIFWDSEPGYDGTTVEYSFDGGATWMSFPVNDSYSYRSGLYDDTGPAPYLAETFAVRSAGASDVRVRFRFLSDGAWSDEDGLWETDGAILVDDIAVSTSLGVSPVFTDMEDFESATPGENSAGIWTGTKGPGFGDYAALYPGVTLLQEDECNFVGGFVWGFFDDPSNANYECHTPDPRPDVGVVPYGNEDGLYIANQIWSPPFDNIGAGDEYRVAMTTYYDSPFSALVFPTRALRCWTDPDGAGPLPLCPGNWRDFTWITWLPSRTWARSFNQVGHLIDPNTEKIQVSAGVVDMCGVWCNIYGTGECHSHAPLYADIRVDRISTAGPSFNVRHADALFQDNFASDGTLTGTARADGAMDILPSSSPGIQPGDSIRMTISPVHAPVGSGPSVWLYARVHNGNNPKSGAGLGSPDSRAGKVGPRWPYVGSWSDINSNTWEIFQMDTTFTSTGGVVSERYCVDLNDDLFVPGDTILYFFGADRDGAPNSGNESYWHRTIDGQGPGRVTDEPNEAAASPCEFTILPAGGYNRGGDFLYVDDTDDRGGPAQLFFDSAFDVMALRDVVDRFDVIAPSSALGNSLASRVTDNVTQIIDVYKTIIWNSGNLSSATIGDGTGWPEKSDDFGLLHQWLDASTDGRGLYISGDDVAEEWAMLGGSGATALRSDYMNFNLVDGDHIDLGEPVSPLLTATGPGFIHMGVPDQLIALGACPIINDFDVLEPLGSAIIEFPYPNSGYGAVVSQVTLNSVGETAVVVLSGFSYHYIRDAHVGWPMARVEHLSDILRNFPYILPQPTGVDPTIEFVNTLEPNYPNPFNPATTIRYGIKEQGHVSLKVYNAAGQLVATLVDEVQSPEQVGPITWQGANNAGQSVSSGVYFYKLVTKDFAKTRKMVLLK